MGLEQIIPAIFLIIVLVLVLPSFLMTNYRSKIFLKNLLIWFLVVASITVFSYLIIKLWKK